MDEWGVFFFFNSPVPEEAKLVSTLLRRQLARLWIAVVVRHQRVCEPRETHLGGVDGLLDFSSAEE